MDKTLIQYKAVHTIDKNGVKTNHYSIYEVKTLISKKHKSITHGELVARVYGKRNKNKVVSALRMLFRSQQRIRLEY